MSGSDSGSVKWTLSSGDVTVEITGTIVGGKIYLTYELVSGTADLNGMFIDYCNNGGSITSIGSKSNNMNGSDTDGDKLDGFDDAKELGTVGGNDADNTGDIVCFEIPDDWCGLSTEEMLEKLAKSEIGIRATSVGEDREGSLKLADTGVYCPPEEETNDFPTMDHDLSNAVFYFKNEDGTFTKVKVEFDTEDLNDLDDADVGNQELVDYIRSLYPQSELIAVTIHAGDGQHNGYLHQGEGPGVWLWQDDDPLDADYTDPGATTGGGPPQPNDPPPTQELIDLGLTEDVLGQSYAGELVYEDLLV